MKKLLPFLVSFVLMFGLFFCGSPQAHAYTVGDIDTEIQSTGNWITDILGDVEGTIGVSQTAANNLKQWVVAQAVNAAKKAAISMVQKQLLGASKSKMITDYGAYLYTAPMQKTNTQMNSYYTATLGGVGGNSYSTYLKTQAQGSVNGVNIKLSINSVVSDPTQPFSTGNMQGMMSLLECGNNPYCYSIAAQSKSSQLFQQNQAIAKAQSSNGYMPTIKNGVITSPASMASNLATSASQMAANAIISTINNSNSASDIINAGVSYVTQLTSQVGQ